MNDPIWALFVATLLACVIVLTMKLRARPSETAPATPDREVTPVPQTADPEVDAARAWQILERMAEGLVVLDARLRPTVANSAARRLLGLQAEILPSRLPSEEVMTVARDALRENRGVEKVVDIWYPARTSLRVKAEILQDSAGGVVVLLEDVTEELRSHRIRREFVAHASHELKSPVASLQTLAEAMRHAVHDDPPTATRFAERMTFEAARLGRLVSDLLDLSRLEDPAYVPDEHVNLSELAERVMEVVRGEVQTKKMTLKTNIGTGVWVLGDEAQLSVLVRNLLENAIRYTPDAGTVSIYLRQEGNEAVLRVSDNGIGIPTEAQERVFERFYRVDKARSRDRGGTGLGLAIVKHVAELHGGGVELESEYGSGSTFTARIPSVTTMPGTIGSAAG